jgi:hypothetical protein
VSGHPTREECWTAAYAVAERALARIARDRATGRLAPAVVAHLDRIAPVQRTAQAA